MTDPTPTPTPDPNPDPNPDPDPSPDPNPEPKSDPDPTPEGEFAFDQIEVPEILDVDNELGQEFLGIMNNKELDRAGTAKAFLDLYAKGVEALLDERSTTWVETNAEWKKAFKADPHYGAQHADENLGKVAKAINDFAAAEKERLGDDAPDVGKALRESLSLTGAGNHPETLKFLIWLSDQSGEGTPLRGQPSGGEQSRADKMFG